MDADTCATRRTITELDRGHAVLLPAPRLFATRHGEMTYAVAGSGTALLVAHGAAGGYDQGLLLSPLLPDFRHIAPSRFGYMGTALPYDAGPDAQADAYAELLDALNITRVAVVGISAGGPTVLHFALRHAQRCYAVVLIAAVCHAYTTHYLRNAMIKTILKADVVCRFVEARLTELRLRANGLRPETLAALAREAPGTLALLRQLMHLSPATARYEGVANDLVQLKYLRDVPLAQIKAPILAIHGTADPVVPHAHSVGLTKKARCARLLSVESGSHLCFVTHHASTVPVVRSFLQKHVSRHVI